MKVAVLGAGVVGVASAYYLAQAGHEVVLVDREGEVAQGATFANGGQLSAGHAKPWANPGTYRQILRGLGRRESPLAMRLRADPAQWRWALRFLGQCLPGPCRQNMADILRLGLYSREALAALRAAEDISFDHSDAGILHYFDDQRALDQAAVDCATLVAGGCDARIVDADGCVTIEPALRAIAPLLAGGLYVPGDESGDARKFTSELADICRARGVTFQSGCDVKHLVSDKSGQVSHAVVRDLPADGCRGETRQTSQTSQTGQATTRSLQADCFVLCMGAVTPLFTRKLGFNLPIYPLKGYSVTVPVRGQVNGKANGENAPTVALTDDSFKIVFSRLGDRLRIAGTAELSGYDAGFDDKTSQARCHAILRRARARFPESADFDKAEFWAGLRPATPGNVPLIGGTRYRNLYINSGHGTLGWTLGCGSGRMVADLVSGRTPEIDPTAFAPYCNAT